MSSPFGASEHSRSTPRSSPSRQRLSGSRSGRVNGHSRSSHRDSSANSNDSPSRQLWEEFGRVVLDDDRSFKRSLDVQTAEQERLHRIALDEALAHHEAVRQSAERARERVDLEIWREQRRREEVERKTVEEQKRRLAAEEAEREEERLADARRTQEQRKQQEARERQKEDMERQAEAERQRLEREKAERLRKTAQEKEDADRKVREEAASREQGLKKAQNPDPPPIQLQPKTNGVTPTTTSKALTTEQQQAPLASAATSGLVSNPEQRKAVHQRYLTLWRRLKAFRIETEKQCKDAGFKDLGELKRSINTQVGMINKTDKAANKIYLTKIEAIFKQALTIAGPTVDIREYLPSADPATLAQATPANAQYPAILLYLLHQFAKRTIRQLIAEGGADTEVCDPIGIILVQVFARPDYQWREHSLIDLLWAKYHFLCPQLFGIRVQEREGEEYFRRVTGLAAGFSAVTLRDFSKSRNRNPAPNTLWWESTARILNLSATQTQMTHFVILKASITDFVPRILQLFGGAGKAVIKNAVTVFPGKAAKVVPKMPGEKAGMAPAVMALDSETGTVTARTGLTAAAGERGGGGVGGFAGYARGGTGSSGGLGAGGGFAAGGFAFGGGGLPSAGFGSSGSFVTNPLGGLPAPSLTTASGVIGFIPTTFTTPPSVAARPAPLTTGFAGMFGGAVMAQGTTGGNPRGPAVFGSGFQGGW
ncbi:hypothetical protein LTR02_014101 [Friedmanniomyces endolithicus]|nr:hypothetical protein LTR94_009843 [Friedmanniomyces endolithicus]KAK0789767.1 hypothetical protein LTR38_010826 [Friedmanniomyces endolithicus]KAK0810661.1 hypothetical protein LTR59_002172 [Friedmanniomyces endolithicus]KAK0869986.1 hypothetical protein LTS02_002761 [Friedmanniomyces endolithicus]KAK0884773.1 hypothetical protein LTR87_001503 [Friedmanniomyces endolithicus]